jgi:hypothetical protein
MGRRLEVNFALLLSARDFVSSQHPVCLDLLFLCRRESLSEKQIF